MAQATCMSENLLLPTGRFVNEKISNAAFKRSLATMA
jgi:hypothetical protein